VYGRNSYPDEIVIGSHVQVVVIPTIDMVNNLHEKRTNLAFNTLKDIKKYLAQFISPHIKIEVSNAVYELLKVRCYLTVHDYTKSGHLYNQLNSELINFLSPNIERPILEKGFEVPISKMKILKFIEERPYVDKVYNLSIFQFVEVGGKYKIIDTNIIKETDFLRTISPYAILTSAPLHHLTIIRSEEDIPSEIEYIDDVAIGSDFIISDENGNYD
ncbi:MAG: hypothetical protein WBN11_00570, partial [Eudoraea sp.]|uniref:hypothetical protein n=1 Tax=Eudoraea sp. TaxID=1979955 RepID=UPI003C76943A